MGLRPLRLACNFAKIKKPAPTLARHLIPMRKALVSFVLLLTSFGFSACTTTMTEEQRLRRQSDANKTTTEKHGKLQFEGEQKSEAFGSRETTSTSASVSIGSK